MSRPGLYVAATLMGLGGREEGGERAGDLTAGVAAAATSCASAVSRSAAIRALTSLAPCWTCQPLAKAR